MHNARLQVVASIGTRLALGAYPLAFIVVFGWAYGKQAFDIAAAAANWANYLNLFLLSGFALVPPAVARLRAGAPERVSDRQVVCDHRALGRWLLASATATALVQWATVGAAFPGLAAQAGGQLALWFLLFAAMALTQLPLTLWLGIAQASGRYAAAFWWIAAPRVLALLSLAAAAYAGAGPTAGIASAVAITVGGQFILVRLSRKALHEVDPEVLHARGRADRVLRANVGAGSIVLVGTLVTIVPVTMIGHLSPGDVGLAHVAVTLSNAVGAVIVAAFFPSSLTLAARVGAPGALKRHYMNVARGVAAAIAAVLALAWAAFPVCARLAVCSANLQVLLSLVLIGAGLRLAALGPYHGALAVGRPHLTLPSAFAEAVGVLAVMLALAAEWGLLTLGVAFVAGGALRAAIALGIEVRRIGAHTA